MFNQVRIAKFESDAAAIIDTKVIANPEKNSDIVMRKIIVNDKGKI
ncbi:hypothetical protein [Leisingera caerulea]|nr:hypothetical protein [Leisingera caerulea]